MPVFQADIKVAMTIYVKAANLAEAEAKIEDVAGHNKALYLSKNDLVIAEDGSFLSPAITTYGIWGGGVENSEIDESCFKDA